MPTAPLGLALAAVAGLGLAASAGAQPAPAASTVRTVLTPHTWRMEDCTADSAQPPPGSVKHVVRVVIRKGYDPTNPVRKVKHKEPGNSQTAEYKADDDEEGKRNDWYGVKTEDKRPFHVDLTQITPTADAYVQIRIVLKANERLRFYTENRINGVGAGDKSNQLCGAHFLTEGKFPVAAFYTLMKPQSTRYPAFAPYNIGLVPLSDEETPFFVDPMVKNHG